MEKEKREGWGGAGDKGHRSIKKERETRKIKAVGPENTGCENYSEHESRND